jgi:hypothetical protein
VHIAVDKGIADVVVADVVAVVVVAVVVVVADLGFADTRHGTDLTIAVDSDTGPQTVRVAVIVVAIVAHY